MDDSADLSRPPITEALIDFRTPVNDRLTPDLLEPVRATLRSRLPEVEEQRALEAMIEIKNATAVIDSKDRGFHGLFFKSTDGFDIAQFRRDGFTVNRLAPYAGWAVLKALAMELLPIFLQYAQPERITRIAVRFINRLTLPISPEQSLGNYLVAPPRVPRGIPSRLSAFLTRVTVHDVRTGLSANISQTLEATNAPNPTVILDIDVFREIAPEFEVSVDVLNKLLEDMRALKNASFFGSITERSVDLYR